MTSDPSSGSWNFRRKSRMRGIAAARRAILERRYRTRFGEIDIIARDGPTLVFVEVKARLSDDFGGAAAAVTAWKQRRDRGRWPIDYLSRRRLHECPCRFDVVAIDFDATGPSVIDSAFDAFSCCLARYDSQRPMNFRIPNDNGRFVTTHS